MAAPSTTARSTPTGLRLDDGYSSKIAFSRRPAVSFWEISGKPPGLDGGNPIETSTMHNSTYHTSAPRRLIKLTDSTFDVAYDPAVISQIITDLIDQVGSVTHHFPDGTTYTYWGYLQKFDPKELKEGARPEASVTITPTNFDPTNDVEAAPVITSVSGT